ARDECGDAEMDERRLNTACGAYSLMCRLPPFSSLMKAPKHWSLPGQGTIVPSPRYRPSSEDSHANVCRNDFGRAAFGVRRLYLRLDTDVELHHRSGGADQSHPRQLGRRGSRLERAEDARP